MNPFNFDDVRDRLRIAGAIKSEEEMGTLFFGKTGSYVSSRKSKMESPSLDALTRMAFNLEQEINDFEEDVRHNNNVSLDRWSRTSILWELHSELMGQIREMVQSTGRIAILDDQDF